MIRSLKKIAVIVMLVAMAVSCSGRGPILLPPPVDTTDDVVYVSAPTSVYLLSSGDDVSVFVVYESGKAETVAVPAEVIQKAAASLNSGINEDVVINYEDFSFTLDIYVAPAGVDENSDPALIDTADEFKAFMKADSTQKVAILTGNMTINFENNDAFMNSGASIYSTDPDNTLTLTGSVSGQAKLYVSADNVTLDGFKIVTGDGSESINIIKVSNVNDATKPVKSVALKNLHVDMAGKCKGIDLNYTDSCTIENCSFGEINKMTGVIQMKRSTGFAIDGVSIESRGNYISDMIYNRIAIESEDDAADKDTNICSGSLSNLDGFGMIQIANGDWEITVNDSDFVKSDNGYQIQQI